MVNTTIRIFSAMCFLLFNHVLSAQTVNNVSAEQQGNALVVHYVLATDSPCEVSLFVSLSGGKAWTGPLLNVSGDVGKNISGGSRSMRWEVLEEMENLVGSHIKFKVVASGKNAYELEMVFVKGGTFMMGINNGENNERPVHQVTLSDFSIGVYEVTQAQWRDVMGGNPSKFSGCDQCPVEQVSWNDVQQFITTLNSKTGKKYRLPTEAEWEYAARGGNQSRGYTYSGSNDFGLAAWCDGNSGSKTHAAGQKQANELGIYDMSGNVWEWCSDWYGPYTSASDVNPSGAYSGQYRVIRGGGCYYLPQGCSVAFRRGNSPDRSFGDLGFRLVLVPVH